MEMDERLKEYCGIKLFFMYPFGKMK